MIWKRCDARGSKVKPLCCKENVELSVYTPGNSPRLVQSLSFFRYLFMTEATSPPSLPSASSLSPCGLSYRRLGPPPWELPPDPPELEDSVSELFLLRLEGGSSPKWTLSALLPPLTELARLLVD